MALTYMQSDKTILFYRVFPTKMKVLILATGLEHKHKMDFQKKHMLI